MQVLPEPSSPAHEGGGLSMLRSVESPAKTSDMQWGMLA